MGDVIKITKTSMERLKESIEDGTFNDVDSACLVTTSFNNGVRDSHFYFFSSDPAALIYALELAKHRALTIRDEDEEPI